MEKYPFFLLPLANGTETVAIPQEDGSYRLHGYKWFSSATDADMTLTLARVQNSDGSTIPVRNLIKRELSLTIVKGSTERGFT